MLVKDLENIKEAARLASSDLVANICSLPAGVIKEKSENFVSFVSALFTMENVIAPFSLASSSAFMVSVVLPDWEKAMTNVFSDSG